MVDSQVLHTYPGNPLSLGIQGASVNFPSLRVFAPKERSFVEDSKKCSFVYSYRLVEELKSTKSELQKS